MPPEHQALRAGRLWRRRTQQRESDGQDCSSRWLRASWDVRGRPWASCCVSWLMWIARGWWATSMWTWRWLWGSWLRRGGCPAPARLCLSWSGWPTMSSVRRVSGTTASRRISWFAPEGSSSLLARATISMPSFVSWRQVHRRRPGCSKSSTRPGWQGELPAVTSSGRLHASASKRRHPGAGSGRASCALGTHRYPVARRGQPRPPSTTRSHAAEPSSTTCAGAEKTPAPDPALTARTSR